jgi:hypothetical protein
MNDKILKYVWIVSCGLVVLFHLGLQLHSGGLFDIGGISLVTNAYILLFITALVYELKLNKVLFLTLLSVSLIMLVYGYCFAGL